MHARVVAFLAALSLSIGAAAPALANYEVKGSPPGKVTVTQMPGHGTLYVILQAPGELVVSDGSGDTILSGVPKGLTVQMAEIAGSLSIDLDLTLPGNLDLRLENSTSLNFTGTANTIDGNVRITAGEGDQEVELAINAPFSVGRTLRIDLGPGDDSVDQDGRDVTVGGNATFSGVNFFEVDGTTTFMRNVTWSAKKETIKTTFDNDDTMAIAGNLKFIGGTADDEVTLNADFSIDGSASIDLGDNDTGLTSFAWFNDADVVVGGKLSVKGQPPVSYRDAVGAIIASDIKLSFRGEGGPNTALFQGTFGGRNIKYSGGDTADTVSYAMTGIPAKIGMKLGDADDTLTLDAGAQIGSLSVDFGDGNDTFDNPFGPDPAFKLKTKNLP